jgi:hypothetical protein
VQIRGIRAPLWPYWVLSEPASRGTLAPCHRTRLCSSAASCSRLAAKRRARRFVHLRSTINRRHQRALPIASQSERIAWRPRTNWARASRLRDLRQAGAPIRPARSTIRRNASAAQSIQSPKAAQQRSEKLQCSPESTCCAHAPRHALAFTCLRSSDSHVGQANTHCYQCGSVSELTWGV